MAAITAADVNKLRTMTGAGMMDCKKALTEANGDFEAARDILRKQGQKIADKRADKRGNGLAGMRERVAAIGGSTACNRTVKPPPIPPRWPSTQGCESSSRRPIASASSWARGPVPSVSAMASSRVR